MSYDNRHKKETGSDIQVIRSSFEDLMSFPNEIFKGYSVIPRKTELVRGILLTRTQDNDYITIYR